MIPAPWFEIIQGADVVSGVRGVFANQIGKHFGVAMAGRPGGRGPDLA